MSLKQIPQALAATAIGVTLQLVPTFVLAEQPVAIHLTSNDRWAQGIGGGETREASPLAGLKNVAPIFNSARKAAYGYAHFVSPSNLYFYGYVGEVTPPQQTTVYYTAYLGSMTVNSVSATGPFQINNQCGTLAYAGPTSCSIDVRFAPIVFGNGQTGILTIQTTDGLDNLVYLNGNTVQGIPDLLPSALDFGSQTVGTASSPQSVTLTNLGNDYLVVNEIRLISPDFSVLLDARPPQKTSTISPSKISSLCPIGPFSIFPGGACDFGVVFGPGSPGLKTSYVFISTTRGEPYVSLTGNGASGMTISITPSKIDFGRVTLNQTSTPKSFVIQATGPNTITISSVSIGPLAGKTASERKVLTDFTLQHNCTSLPFGSQCEGTILFKPSAIGVREADVVIAGDFEGSPSKIGLTGLGQKLPSPYLTLSTAGVGFGQRGFGDRSAPQMVTLTNSGELPLVLSAIYTIGDFYKSHNCPITLSPGDSCIVTVGFNATVPGLRKGALIIESNASNGGTQRVELEGTGCKFFSISRSNYVSANCTP